MKASNYRILKTKKQRRKQPVSLMEKPIEKILGFRQVAFKTVNETYSRKKAIPFTKDSSYSLYDYVKPKYGSINKSKKGIYKMFSKK